MRLNNFKKKLICWGAGDQAIVLEPIIKSLGAKYDVFVDDTQDKASPFEEVELLAGKRAFEKWFLGRNASEYGFIIAIGNPYGYVRCMLHEYLLSKGIAPVTICDPSALLDHNVKVKDGAQIMKGVIVNAYAEIDKQVILNTRCTIEHHDELLEGVEIGPGATLCGRVIVNKHSWICAGATILPKMLIGENTIIGAGALVRTNVPDDSIFTGVPASFLKKNKYKV